MGPTAPENHNNNRLRAGGLWIAGKGRGSTVWARCCPVLAFVFLAIVFVVRVLSPSPPRPESVKVQTAETQPRRVQRTRTHTPLAVFDSETYYSTIIDNNLFRPLGWRPPVPREPYRLLGTKLATDANTPPQAILQSTAGQTTYIVSIGENLDVSTEVVSIESKAVTLSSNGQQRTLRLNTALYLNPSPARRHPIRTTHTPTPAPIRTPTPMRRPPAVSAPQTDRPPSPRRPLSDWETREGEPIRFGDARLKNPQKWGLRRR